MDCPKCQSCQKKKNGFRRGKQSYRCKNCGFQDVEHPRSQGYSQEVRQICIKMYLNGMGLRGISRVTQISHTTILNWIREAGESLSDEPQDSEIPEITEIDELQTPTHLECIKPPHFPAVHGGKQRAEWKAGCIPHLRGQQKKTNTGFGV